mmetsp:Transcript_24523/g.23579  ORF Transcript_24523/g.23579 Transcript_24523/m.23579 type:complete len:92 (-) Transcript_24523:308-583(-)|eukprot:CAMPEP_0197833460 /NCGR_PEP_ID=MMETSP1437-20131217/19094_1 /TAXON_ID=49252 ORGANISM="Eucampia antarctica, Strain CCMP1452" /NCGR_SAMPLE_ID=MMETSP1437 /ASSEMBLY_ACC=CAM_ASM_001096 /LENGTH=91 /DNA_ID=CAMNT_0043437531 /DNA_START=98 /DNA_END=373 /DNA_ORIENTATION=+
MASRQAIAAVQRQIFGTLPNKNVRTGNQVLKKRFTGPMLERYYLEPIEPSARFTMPEYTSEIQQRRLDKLETLRRRGKGPPKKGSGKRSKK